MITRYPRAALIALCLLLYLPGLFTLPPLDRDEARFVQSSKQMVQSGDYVNIWFQDEPRHKKPIGIYWLQSISAKLFGADAMGAYRLISLLAAIGAVLSLHYWLSLYMSSLRKQVSCESDATDSRVRGKDNHGVAFVAAALLASTLGLTLEAHQAKTDAALLLCIMTMQGVLLNVWAAQSRPRLLPFVYWLALGAAVLIKGPVALLVGGLTVAALLIMDKSLALVWKMRPFLGAALAALVVAPWLYAIQAETGGAFLSGGYAEDVLPKLLGGVESHGAPPGYYLLLLPVFFWPAIALLLPAIPAIWQARREPIVRFALAWLLPSWLAIELIPTKLPHYVLPLYPALALLVAYALVHGQFSARLAKVGKALWLLVALVLCGALLYLPQHLQMPVPTAAYALAALGTLLALAALFRLRFAIAFQLVMLGFIFQFFLPSMQPMWLSKQLSEVLAGAADAPIAIAGYHEPSAVFLLGTQTRLTDAASVAGFMYEKGDGAIGIVEASQRGAFEARLAQDGTIAAQIGSVSGLNYAKGKWLELLIFQVKAPAEVNEGGAPDAKEENGQDD